MVMALDKPLKLVCTQCRWQHSQLIKKPADLAMARAITQCPKCGGVVKTQTAAWGFGIKS